jgi:hypothetical protein
LFLLTTKKFWSLFIAFFVLSIFCFPHNCHRGEEKFSLKIPNIYFPNKNSVFVLLLPLVNILLAGKSIWYGG